MPQAAMRAAYAKCSHTKAHLNSSFTMYLPRTQVAKRNVERRSYGSNDGGLSKARIMRRVADLAPTDLSSTGTKKTSEPEIQTELSMCYHTYGHSASLWSM